MIHRFVFVNYRRDDSSSESLAIFNALRQEFGENSAFMDISSLEVGVLWPEEIQSTLNGSKVVLAVIGSNWLRAGSDEWGQRRIDRENDWVRQELAMAITANKRIIPVLVNGARMPPTEVLPDSIKALSQRQGIELRRDYWNHDIKLLLAQLSEIINPPSDYNTSLGPYPRNFPEGPDPLSDDKIQKILETELHLWKKLIAPLPENPSEVRVELFREFRFRSFQDAIRFMILVAPGCDIAMHHPRWENIWKTIRIYLSTWDIGHRISDRDIQLARYFDRAYAEFEGAVKVKSN